MNQDRHAALEAVAGPVSRETFSRLYAFEATFRKWVRRINLVADSTLGSLWERHILDSAQLLPLAPDARRWLDLGSGGGFPGAVIAILLADRPGFTIDLVENNHKKAAFLRTALGGLPARVHRRRIEDCHRLIAPPDIVTARALAPLPTLFGLAAPWLAGGARGLFHKGRDYRWEIQESRDAWQFDLVEHADRVDPRGIILDVTGLDRR